ncbi:MAG: hypothetical protein ACUVUR_07395 [bacterium]
MSPIKVVTALFTAALTLPLFGAWVTTGIDTITDTRARKTLSMQSLAVDTSLTLHAVWIERLGAGPNYLLYSSKSPSSHWCTPETIAESVAVRVALSVEKNTGIAHIAFIQQFADTTELCYATNRTGIWEKIRITKDTIPDFTPTIALESDSFVHIAWVTREPSIAFRIGYATNRTSTWETQILRQSQLGDFGTGAMPYLTISPTGIAHITYRGGNYPDYHIHHAENNAPGDTNWSYEVLTTGNNFDYISALAAHDGEELFLVASGNDGWGMPFRTHYLHRPPNSLNWDQYQLITASASAQMEGFCMDSGNVHITWQLINGNIIMEQLYHCSNYAGLWFNSPIRADSHTTGGAIVVDYSHCGHVLAIIETQSDTELYCIHSAPFTGIAESENDHEPIRLILSTFVKNRVNIFLPFENTGQAEIYTINGTRLCTLKAEQNQIQWDCRAENGASLASGIYIVRCGNRLGRILLIR